MSDHETEKAIADELRRWADSARDVGVLRVSVHDLRERADELDPPPTPLPTEPRWHPEVSARVRAALDGTP